MSELEDWTRRIDETVQRIARLMRTDAKRFVHDSMREAFVAARTPADAATVAQLKARTLTEADVVATRLHDALLAVDWIGEAPTELSDPPRLTDFGAVATAVATMVDAVRDLLDGQGFPAEVSYRLPQRFIDHDALPSLTRNLLKGIARLTALREAAEARRTAQTAEARRQLWEDA